MYNFFETLGDLVKVGNIFEIAGFSSVSAQCFTIVLSTGSNPNSDTALAIVTNFVERKIVRSAFINGNFVASEENANVASLSYGSAMPLVVGESFNFCILVGDDRFHIAVNDIPYATYKFQIPINLIRSLLVYGDIDTVTKANQIQTFPIIFPSIRSDYDGLAFEGYISRQYKPGSLVTVSGMVHGEPDSRFVIMFTEDETSREMIHFNVRFDEASVVMNAMTADEDWSENEVRTDHFPFAFGQPFKVTFAFTHSHVKVAANGMNLMGFSYDSIELGEGNESIWDILAGFRIKNDGTTVNVNNVYHVQLPDEECNNFELYSAL